MSRFLVLTGAIVATSLLSASFGFASKGPPSRGARTTTSERVGQRVDISRVPSAPPAPMTRAEFSHEGITRSYSLFSPPRTSSSPGPRPLLVLLHGCGQDAETFANATRMNELAIRENAFVLYPEQSPQVNAFRCWSWYQPSNQMRDAGASEREWMAALVQSVATALGADRSKVFIAGLSAGAAMAVNMLSCHPELFAAAGVFAGIPFAAANDSSTGLRAMKNGSTLPPGDSAAKAFACGGQKLGRPVSVFIAHGEADKVVDKTNARQILKHFEAFNDLRDDGIANGSFVFQARGVKSTKARKGTYAHMLKAFSSKSPESAGARLLKVKKLGHSWSGGNGQQPFTDSKGPSASDFMWDFFSSL